jgi:hypothetical protein
VGPRGSAGGGPEPARVTGTGARPPRGPRPPAPGR